MTSAAAATEPATATIEFHDNTTRWRVVLSCVPLWQVEAFAASSDDLGEVDRLLATAAITAVVVNGATEPVTVDMVGRMWDGWALGDRAAVATAARGLAGGDGGMAARYLKRLRADPGLAAVLDHCVPLGIPLTTFLGGPAGWDDVSRAAALAWSADQVARCGDCGQRRSDWMRADADGHLVEIVPPPFRVVDQVCPACAAGERASRARRADGDLEPGMKLAYQRVDPAAS